jgi:polyisoprenoid-binding protein YceI
MRKLTMMLLFPLLLASSAVAQGWKLDKAHSGVQFTVRHMVISDVAGKFTNYDITFNSSKEDFSDAAVEATIKTASINTDNEKRDGHLKSDDFFNAEKFPTIKFTSTEFKMTGENTYAITGDLTIRDVTKKVTFNAIYAGSIKSPWGNTVSAWKASTVINRFDYNLKWSAALETGGLVVGQDVTVTLNLELTK